MLQVDVVLITRGRHEWLRRCIHSVRDSAERAGIGARLLVGLNGADDESARVLHELDVGFKTFEPTTPADARNRLLPLSTAEWVCFIDDDAFAPPGYFSEFLKAAGRNPEASAIGGPNFTPPAASSQERAVGEVLSHRFATFTSSARYAARGPERACDESALILCNLFIRRSTLLRERFPARIDCAEENWLLARVKRGGGGLVYSPGLYVYHERRPTIATLGRQVFKYGLGRGQNLRLQPETARVPHLLPAFCVLYAPLSAMAAALGASKAVLVAPVAAYALLCGFFSLGFPKLRLRVLALFPVIHSCYGLGVIAGLARVKATILETHSPIERAP
ncbi:MAG: glycosyltransferase family 2 protein [Deltaproteobacteria bacterium]|nr:glycosyltransferase family 2 protein [Deltaproteobacteria bacterium]